MSKVTFNEAFNFFKNWLYTDEENFPEEYLERLPENTIITCLYQHDRARQILNEYVNRRELNLDKLELIKFIRFLVRKFCISHNKIWPLFKKYSQNKVSEEIRKLPFIKPYEIPIVENLLKIPQYKKEKPKKYTFTKILNLFRNIKQKRNECKACGLYNQPIVLFDTNSHKDISNIDILFVAEAPGETEVQEGVPLIGKAGQRLRPFINRFCSNLKWFMTNTCLCRPPGNRTPSDLEMNCCKQNLDKVIEITNPQIIVALGGTAINRFGVDISTGILNKRKQIFEYKLNEKTYKVFCTVHPSYILRNNNDSIYEEDFLELQNHIFPTKNITNKINDSVHTIKLKPDYYSMDLVDIQKLKHQILYIFRQDGQKKYVKLPISATSYFYFTNKPNDEFIKNVKDVILVTGSSNKNTSNITNYESDVEPTLRHSVDYFFNRKVPNEYKPKTMYLDIEVATKNKEFPNPNEVKFPISIITIKTESELISLVNTKQQIPKTIDNSSIITCSTEKELFMKFFEILHESDVDIITAWNISFDLGYMINRLEKKLKLSSRNFSPINERCDVDLERNHIFIPGLIVIDLLSAYRSLTYGDRESYSLNYISEIELGESKLEKGSDFGQLFSEDIVRAIRYNIDDVEKIYKIDKKLGIIEYLNELRNVASIPWKDCMVTSKIVEGNLLRFCKEKNVVIRNRYPNIKTKYEKVGAYVKTPVPGIHDNVFLVDFKSLYPSIMMTFNIGPDTYIARFENYWYDVIDFLNGKNKSYHIIINPHLKPEVTSMTHQEVKEFLSNKILTPYGTIFEKHKTSIVHDVLQYLLEQRAHYKKLLKENPESTEFDNKQRSYKEIANSNYGYFGFEGSRLFITDIVNSVTVTGQFLIKLSALYTNSMLKNETINIEEASKFILTNNWIQEKTEKSKTYIEPNDLEFDGFIYTDTDSIFYQLGNNVEECETIGNKIFGRINKEIFVEELPQIFNLETNRIYLLLEHEATCKGYWVGEKKRYAYITYPITDPPKLKIKGLETQRSDYPRTTREKLKPILNMLLLENDPMQKIETYIKEVYEEFKVRIQKYDLTVCRPVSYSTSSYKKVPSHVVGMHLWNILNNREDFRPGVKGYQFYIKFNINAIKDQKISNKVKEMLHNFKFKGNITNIVVPEDTTYEELKEFFSVWGNESLVNTPVLSIDIDKMLDFIWVQRCINLLKGIGDISYIFGKTSSSNGNLSEFNLFNI